MIDYVSLIIDIENSRGYNVSDRSEMQRFMIDCINRLNLVFKPSLQFKVTFSAGDEMQGLFYDTISAILYLRMLELLIKPVRIRAGIGIGAWSIKVEGGQSTQQDGPVYHKARQALEEVSKKQTQRYRICSGNDDRMANYLLNASKVLKEQQIYTQNIAIIVMELLYPFTKRNLALYQHEVMAELLTKKYLYKIGKHRAWSPAYIAKENSDTVFNVEKLNVIEPIYIDGNCFDTEESIIRKNMSSNIAEVLGCKRQNADMLIKRGNSIIIRNMDYMALQYIEREYQTNDL